MKIETLSVGKLAHGATVLALVLALGPVHADTAGEDLAQLDLKTLMSMDVMVVTAQRREENASTVPISMSIVKADAIAGLNLVSTLDLQTVAPGLTTNNSFGFMFPYIRGVGTDINSSGIDPSVAVYVDGIYQADRVQAIVQLADVAQVEVLKGPQGTLYGRNATGGAINITTRAPSDRFEALVQADVGSYGTRGATVFLGGPLSERLRVSLSGVGHERSGYYTNLFNGAEVMTNDFYSMQTRLQYDVSTNFKAEVMLKYFSRDDMGTYGTQLDENAVLLQAGIPQATRPFETFADFTDSADRLDSTTSVLKLDWNLAQLHLQSLSAHSRQNHRLFFDGDISPVPLVHVRSFEHADAFTQELQLSPLDQSGRLDWIVGAFYIDGFAGFSPATVETFDALTLTPLTIYSTRGIGTQAHAAFGDVTYALDSQWSITAGLRYSSETKRLGSGRVGATGFEEVVLPAQSQQWSDTNYRFVVKHTSGDTMVYAKTETGFKSGAFNNANALRPGPIDPEHITAYELGLKSGIGRLPLRVSLAAFYNDYRDLQIQVQDQDAALATVLQQAPRATTYGLDANLEWKLSEYFDLTVGLSRLEAEYREFVADAVLVPSPFGGNLKAPDLDLAGKKLSRSPELTANSLARFSYPLGPGTLVATANYYYSSRYYFEPANSYAQAPFDLINASIGYRSRNRWEISAWARNLGNSRHLETVIPDSLGEVGVYAEPRIFGLSVGYSFAN